MQVIDIRKGVFKSIKIETTDPINNVKFDPFNRSYIGVGCENVLVYDLNNSEKPYINYFGHRGMILDLDWNESDPWSIISTSESNGGSVHIWRIIDLL